MEVRNIRILFFFQINYMKGLNTVETNFKSEARLLASPTCWLAENRPGAEFKLDWAAIVCKEGRARKHANDLVVPPPVPGPDSKNIPAFESYFNKRLFFWMPWKMWAYVSSARMAPNARHLSRQKALQPGPNSHRCKKTILLGRRVLGMPKM